MKIRIVLADTDERYISHFMKAMRMFYLNEVDVVAFSQEESLQKYVDSNVFDILLQSMTFPNINLVRGVRVRLVNTPGIKEVEGEFAVCKFQKIDRIYKEILNVLAEEKKGITYSSNSEMETRVIGVSSAAGGTGKTTIAVSYARALAAKGYQVLYLSLENFSPLNLYFHSEGDLNMSNVLFAVKCKKGNLQLKVESAIRQVFGGIYYLEPSPNPIEVEEMKESEWKELLQAIKEMGKFHAVVLDLPDMLSKVTKSIVKNVEQIVIVTDDKDTTLAKTQIMLDCYRQLDASQKIDVCAKMIAVQNRSGGPRTEIGIPVLVQVPLISTSQKENLIIDAIVNSTVSEGLLKIYTPGGEANV